MRSVNGHLRRTCVAWQRTVYMRASLTVFVCSWEVQTFHWPGTRSCCRREICTAHVHTTIAHTECTDINVHAAFTLLCRDIGQVVDQKTRWRIPRPLFDILCGDVIEWANFYRMLRLHGFRLPNPNIYGEGWEYRIEYRKVGVVCAILSFGLPFALYPYFAHLISSELDWRQSEHSVHAYGFRLSSAIQFSSDEIRWVMWSYEPSLWPKITSSCSIEQHKQPKICNDCLK